MVEDREVVAVVVAVVVDVVEQQLALVASLRLPRKAPQA